jgi:hypothetical protein
VNQSADYRKNDSVRFGVLEGSSGHNDDRGQNRNWQTLIYYKGQIAAYTSAIADKRKRKNEERLHKGS